MADLKVPYRLCWGDIVVPLQSDTLDFVNMHRIEGMGDDEEEGVEFSLVEFKGSMPRCWTEKALGLRARWWMSDISKAPLMKEVSEAMIKNDIYVDIVNPTLSWPKFASKWSS